MKRVSVEANFNVEIRRDPDIMDKNHRHCEENDLFRITRDYFADYLCYFTSTGMLPEKKKKN